MLGIKDPWVFIAYFASILSAVLCIAYGMVTWNKGDEPVKQEDVQWAEEEKEEIESIS